MALGLFLFVGECSAFNTATLGQYLWEIFWEFPQKILLSIAFMCSEEGGLCNDRGNQPSNFRATNCNSFVIYQSLAIILYLLNLLI